MFWRENGAGYTMDISDAGRYTWKEAKSRIMDDRNVAIPAFAIDLDALVRSLPRSALTRAREHEITYEAFRSNTL